MLIKAYIKKDFFHLPMDEGELLYQVEAALKKGVNKAKIGRLYPVTKVEDNDNILIEKQRTNIFLLNMLLNVLNHNGKEVTEQRHFNEEYIIGKLEAETGLDLKALPFEGVEQKVGEYLNPTPEERRDEPEEGLMPQDTQQPTSYLRNVQFNVDWLKGAQQELNQLATKRRE